MAASTRDGGHDYPRDPPGGGRRKARSRPALAAASGLAILAAAGLWVGTSSDATEVLVYKSPTCGCCNKWVSYLEANGFRVRTEDVADLSPIKASHGIAPQLAACHTALVEGYVVEGHVPAEDIRRLLAERPAVRGLTVPGMPAGSPGMEAPRKDAYETLTFDVEGRTRVYARH